MKQAVYGAQQIRGLDGLQEKRLGRLLGFQDAGAASLVGRQSAHGDDPDIGAELRQRAGQFRAAETGHVHIGDDEGDFRGTGDEQDDSLHAVGAAHDTVAVLFENGGADMAEPFVVVHDEDQFAVTVWNVNGRGARGLGRLALNGGQEHAERRAAANHRVQFDEAFVVGHDTAHRGKPEPGALARSLGREERGPDSFQYIGRDAGARVADLEYEPRSRPGSRYLGGLRRIEPAVGRGDAQCASLWHGVSVRTGQTVLQRRVATHPAELLPRVLDNSYSPVSYSPCIVFSAQNPIP